MPKIHRREEERADLVCKKCQYPQMRRVRRQGWWEREFFPHLGLYPWECIDCRQITMHRLRKAPDSTHSTHPERFRPDVPPSEAVNPAAVTKASSKDATAQQLNKA